MQIPCNVYCRGGVLPVGETSRSDSGGCSPLGRRHEVTVGDSPVRGNVRKADKRVAVLAERKASPPRNAPPAYIQVRTASALSSR